MISINMYAFWKLYIYFDPTSMVFYKVIFCIFNVKNYTQMPMNSTLTPCLELHVYVKNIITD